MRCSAASGCGPLSQTRASVLTASQLASYNEIKSSTRHALLLRLCFCCSLLEPRHRSVLQHDMISFLSFTRRLTGWDDGIALHLSASMVAGLISTTATSPGGRLQGLVEFVAGFLQELSLLDIPA